MKRETIILLFFIVAKFVFQYVLISPDYDLQRDEYLHLDQAQHPALGYLSVPPFTSWIAALIFLLGNSVFWIKFFPALFGVLTLIVVWKTIEELKGNLFALILGATCVFFSALLRLNTLFQPNSFDVLAWTTIYFIYIKYINTRNHKWLFIGAFVFALGVLNKYNIAFLAIGLLPAILLSSERILFINKKFYWSVLLAFIFISPNLYWQYSNGFPVIHHMKELAETQLVNVDRFDFLKSQLLFFIGGLFVIIAGLFSLLFYKPFGKYRVLFFSFLFTLLTFLYFKAKDYYAIGLYPIYIAFGSVYVSTFLKVGWRRYLQPIIIAIPILLFIPLFEIAFPNKSPEEIVANSGPYKKFNLLRWEDGKDHELPQDFADMLGWKELASTVDSIFSLLPDTAYNFVLCDNYGEAGAINYYKKNSSLVASSFNGDYINWLNTSRQITNVILVKEPGDEDPKRVTERPLFDTVYLAAKRVNKFSREQEISIYVLQGARTDINKRIMDEARSKSWSKEL